MAQVSWLFAPPQLSHFTFRVWQRNLTVFRKIFFTSLMPNFFEPLIYILGMGFGLGMFVSNINGIPYANFLAPGLIASSAMFAVSFECTFGSFIRMEFQKTYEAIVATPASVDDVVAGEILWGTTKSVLYGSIILLVITVLGLVKSGFALVIPVVLAANGFLFANLAMIVTALVPKIDNFDYYFSLVVTPMFMFSGIFFPLTGLPRFARAIAWFTPLYHMVNLSRGLALGQLSAGLWLDLAWLVVVGAAIFVLPINLMRRKLIQ